jgi:hypothetical protein
MSWNLLIYKPGAGEGEQAPMGTIESVTNALNAAFPALQWDSATECILPVDKGFAISLTLTTEDNAVSDLYTRGGYYHLKPLAALCKGQGWRIADAQEGEDLNLDDPYASYGGQEQE